MKVYLAGPFFNEEQLALVEKLEILIEEECACELFSPRRDIILPPGATYEDRKKVFIANTEGIEECDLVLAIIDGRDTGTIWELGYAFRSHKPIFTYTDKGFGMNLMLAMATVGHFKTMDELRENLELARAAINVGGESMFRVIAEVKAKYFYQDLLAEGPKEHV